MKICYKQCPLPTTALSVQNMASAQNTKSSIPYTPLLSVTSKITRDTLRSVSCAIAEMLRRNAPRASKIGESVDVGAVVDDVIITDVSLLAHGSYNLIWLVKLRTHVDVKVQSTFFFFLDC